MLELCHSVLNRKRMPDERQTNVLEPTVFSKEKEM